MMMMLADVACVLVKEKLIILKTGKNGFLKEKKRFFISFKHSSEIIIIIIIIMLIKWAIVCEGEKTKI